MCVEIYRQKRKVINEFCSKVFSSLYDLYGCEKFQTYMGQFKRGVLELR